MKKLLAALLCIALLGGCSNPQKDQYNQAKEYMENGEYHEAMEVLRELGDYQDSQELLLEATYQYGLVKLNKKNYTGAIELFDECGDYQDAAEKSVDTKLAYIHSKLDNLDREKYLSEDDDAYLYLMELVEAGNQKAIDIYNSATEYVIEPAGYMYDFMFAVKSKIPVTIENVSYKIIMDTGEIVTGDLGTMTTGEPVQVHELGKLNGETVLLIGETGWLVFPHPATYEFYDGSGNLIYSVHQPVMW